jgi:hypothetical protein
MGVVYEYLSKAHPAVRLSTTSLTLLVAKEKNYQWAHACSSLSVSAGTFADVTIVTKDSRLLAASNSK